MSWIGKALDSLRQLWLGFNPGCAPTPQAPVLRRLNEYQAELTWQGAPFLFDRRSQTITRSGGVMHYSAIKSILISVSRTEHEEWSVALETGVFSRVSIGRTREQVDASIAAAHIATLTGKQVLA